MNKVITVDALNHTLDGGLNEVIAIAELIN